MIHRGGNHRIISHIKNVGKTTPKLCCCSRCDQKPYIFIWLRSWLKLMFAFCADLKSVVKSQSWNWQSKTSSNFKQVLMLMWDGLCNGQYFSVRVLFSVFRWVVDSSIILRFDSLCRVSGVMQTKEDTQSCIKSPATVLNLFRCQSCSAVESCSTSPSIQYVFAQPFKLKLRTCT